jgi:hypothetical protein
MQGTKNNARPKTSQFNIKPVTNMKTKRKNTKIRMANAMVARNVLGSLKRIAK